eukprot:CAMPEP_0201153680 /NCGR_PEP_ID=MMETSP0851-20130426/14062_1 /ASSEMBLY_ACC=CAM_ASM_000631 /TAXON_ID=183588 /ORGANISM="Pseudo-nitzschia fraudulenta, Strain WWA7" /LENGTH=70 /DNA_ID=CAMNT_0047430927 /DNA_START=43 /DNA_END=252 /DNA_ORIENTATION=-
MSDPKKADPKKPAAAAGLSRLSGYSFVIGVVVTTVMLLTIHSMQWMAGSFAQNGEAVSTVSLRGPSSSSP